MAQSPVLRVSPLTCDAIHDDLRVLRQIGVLNHLFSHSVKTQKGELLKSETF